MTGPAAQKGLSRSSLMRAAAVRGPVWVAVVLLFLLASVLSPAFFSLEEVRNIAQVTSFLGIAAIGQTIAILVGGIDLSIGGVVTLTNILWTSLNSKRQPAATVLVVGF